MFRMNHYKNLPALALTLVGLIAIASFWQPRPAVAQGTTATLVRTIQTSQWNPPSPDPSGITYWPGRNTLFISDGEVEEMPQYFEGDNLFEATTAGTLVDTYSTTAFSNEPVGVEIAIDPVHNTLFVTDDNQKRVYVIGLGADGRYGTSDDTRTSFSTTAFGDEDPEGIAYGSGKLFLTSGVGAEVYVLTPGANGQFDGVAPTGDDQVTQWDTGVLNQPDPEGIEYNSDTGTLFIVSNKNKWDITEATTTGALVRTIEASFLNSNSPSDLTFAPSSANPRVKNLFMTDRGVDNNQDPDENDGKIYELSLTSGPPPSSNLLANPGFELDGNNDGKPDTWSTNTKFTRSNAVVHGGSYAGQHQATDNSGHTIKQIVKNLSAGTTYNFTTWVNILTTSDKFTFKIQVKWRNSSNSVIRTDTIKSYTDDTADTWNQTTTSIVAPAGTTNAVFSLTASSLNGTIYVDDFEFKP